MLLSLDRREDFTTKFTKATKGSRADLVGKRSWWIKRAGLDSFFVFFVLEDFVTSRFRHSLFESQGGRGQTAAAPPSPTWKVAPSVPGLICMPVLVRLVA